MRLLLAVALVLLQIVVLASPCSAFTVSPTASTTSANARRIANGASNGATFQTTLSSPIHRTKTTTSRLHMARISKERRAELGIPDDEDEYDLDKALETNTDPLITKIIAGSLILAIFGLLVVGVIIPLNTDYGDGVCNPLLSAGRCL